MNFLIISIIVGLIVVSSSQWQSYHLLYSDAKFTYKNDSSAQMHSGGFLLPSRETTANFIDCNSPSTSYITLNSTYPQTRSSFMITLKNGYLFSVDFYFQGTWTSQTVTIMINQVQYTYNYTSPKNYQSTSGFCDDFAYEVKTVTFTYQQPNQTSGQLIFTSQNTNDGQVSIRNISITQPKCYPSCKQCTGPQFNQCTSCYYGIPINNICLSNPSILQNQKEHICRDICDININVSCQSNGFQKSYQKETCVKNQIKLCAPQNQLQEAEICIPIHEDQIKISDEQYKDQFIQPYQGCQSFQAKCQSSCIQCDNTGCGCQTCKVGYRKIDNVLTEGEECDDGNLNFEDGCHQCSLNCPISCSLCLYGHCIRCKNNHIYFKNQCYEIQEKIIMKDMFKIQFSNLNITQAFIQPDQVSTIQIKIENFYEINNRWFIQTMESLSLFQENHNIEINFQCSQNKKVMSQFFQSYNENGIDFQDRIFLNECANMVDQVIINDVDKQLIDNQYFQR